MRVAEVQEQDRRELQERYRRRWLEYGYDVRTLGWMKDCQHVRFAAAVEGLRIANIETLLDVGCGFGDLLDYLRAQGWTGHYTGIDLSAELLNEAVRRHGGDRSATFREGDFQSVALPRVDVAIALGVANHRLHEGNLAFIRRTLDVMWSATRDVVVFDFLSATADPERRRDDLFYADAGEIYAMAASYSRRVIVHHAYMPFEFQVKIWHDASFAVDAPVFASYAHLADARSRQR